MSLLSKKTDENGKDKVQKKKKFKRKKDVFGKRLVRIWLILLMVVEFAAIAASSFVVKQKQDKKQDTIDSEIATLNRDINRLLNLSHSRQTTYEDIGTLVATLPSSFDKQTCNIDLERLLTLSGLSENTSIPRRIDDSETVKSPFNISVTTIKAVQINLYVYTEDIEYLENFLDNVTDYEQENFFYVSSISYTKDARGTTSIILYTFYNNVNI